MPPGTDHDSVYREWEMAVDRYTDPSCWRSGHTSKSVPSKTTARIPKTPGR